MRASWLLLVALAVSASADDRWWERMFAAEDRPLPPQPALTDSLVLDPDVDAASDRFRGLLWMSLVTGGGASEPLEAVWQREQEVQGREEVLQTLLGSASREGRHDFIKLLDLEEIRTLVTRYRESQGLASAALSAESPMPVRYDEGEPVARWVRRHVLPALPEMLVRWGASLDVVNRLGWSFSHERFGGDPTLLSQHVEVSEKRVDIRMLERLSIEVGIMHELQDNRPEDDLFGPGSTEPFASVMWKF